jgi:hypothetical protein
MGESVTLLKILTKRSARVGMKATLTVLFFVLLWFGELRHAEAANVAHYTDYNQSADGQLTLSPIWKSIIQQWAPQIHEAAEISGLDPDFIAAVIREESNGDPQVISRVGAVGLMGVMPTSPGLEWRPAAEELMNPATNLSWGVAILAEVVRQSGGDLYAALAAYSGGWDQVNSRVPQDYAASVLDYYGRAIMARIGLSSDFASQWTLAVEIQGGYVPPDPLLVLGDQPISGLITFGKHVVYNYIDQMGHRYRVIGYAVPVALVVPMGAENATFGSADVLEAELQARLGETGEKIDGSNTRVIIACLPSLSRLRGHASTRWFAPTQCPSWHR